VGGPSCNASVVSKAQCDLKRNFLLQQRHCRLYVAEAKVAIDGNGWPVTTVRQHRHLAEALEFAEEALDAADAMVAQYVAAHPSRSGGSAAAGTSADSGSTTTASSAAATAVVGSAGGAGGNSDGESDDEGSAPHVPAEPLSCSDDDDEFGDDGWG